MNKEKPTEIVYVLTNPAMPELTKIGITRNKDVETRFRQLYTTAVPFPFKCVFACQVKDSAEVESALQMAFEKYRVNPKREFYEIQPKNVIAVLQLLSVKDVTPQVDKKLSKELDNTDKKSRDDFERSRRPLMNFAKMEIPKGSPLIYKDGKKQVTVVDDRRVKYKGRVRYLAGVTKEILGKGRGYQIQPSPYWTYQGKTLKTIYDETYEV